MKGRNGKPIIRWSFSPSLQISDWSWGSHIDRTFGIPVARAARTRRQQLGRGKETRSAAAAGFCCCTFAAWDWPPLPVTAGLALLLQPPILPQLPQRPLQHREAPAAVQGPCWVCLPPSPQETHTPHEGHSPDWFAIPSMGGSTTATPKPLHHHYFGKSKMFFVIVVWQQV